MQKSFKYLLALFALIALVKSIISLLISGPVIFTDEICVLLRSEYFIKFFEIKECTKLITFPAGDPMPLYSILISPLYLFIDATKAYHGALIINSILISSLIFPLYYLFKKVIKKNWIIFPTIALLLFTPPIFHYEKLVMTEALFIVINVWFVYFYLKSFEKNTVRNKIIAIILALFSTITRPFGFITLLALIVNEIANSKRKKGLTLIFVLTIIALFLLLPLQLPGIWEQIWDKILSLAQGGNLKLAIEAVKNQANSFIVATYLIPLVFFFGYILKKDNEFKKIRIFLLSFLIFNFAISAQHLYSYLLNGEQLSLLTRYVNMSVIYILIFGAIFFFKEKHFKWDKIRIITTAIIFLPLIFFSYTPVKHSLNMDISHYYYTGIGYIVSRGFLSPYFITTCIALLLLVIFNKKRTVTIFLTIIFLINSVAIFIWEKNFAYEEYEDYSWDLFKDSELRILFIQTYLNPTLTYGKLRTLTDNEVDITFQPLIQLDTIKDYDYIISTGEVPFEPIGATDYSENIYKVPK